LTFAVLLALVSPAGAGDIPVPPGSIQAAIDNASPGHTIVISAGAYTESLTLSKPVSLTGVSSATTIIHAVPGQRVLTVTGSTISNSVVIASLTFAGGNAAGSGGGVLIQDGARPRLLDVIFRDNHATLYGGGLSAYAGSPLELSGVAFIDNTAGMYGGGAYVTDGVTVTSCWFQDNEGAMGIGGLLADSSLHATGCTFIGNSGRDEGGAVYVYDAATVVDCWFQDNESSQSGGGGLYANGRLDMTGSTFISNTARECGGGACAGGEYSNEPAMVADCRFERNRCTNSSCEGGGGLYAYGDLDMRDTTFLSNTTEGDGGGAYVRGEGIVVDAWFEGNRATHGTSGDGGALYQYHSYDRMAVTGTVFINNTAAGSGGALYSASDNGGRLVNVLFARNTAAVDGAALFLRGSGLMELIHATVADYGLNPGHAVYVSNRPVAITNTIISSHTVGIENEAGTVSEDYNLFFANTHPVSGTGIVIGAHTLVGPAADPMFLNPLADYYRQGLASPAVDSGVDLGIATDLDGIMRTMGPDRGAYEVARVFAPAVLR
jgi:predicted outer membrane repeat protein